MGSQAAVDTGKLVLGWDKPYWLAGHNYRGWQCLAFVPTGARVVVTGGRATGTSVVTGHKRLARQSRPMPGVRADLVLQTCVGERPASPCCVAPEPSSIRAAHHEGERPSTSSSDLHPSHAELRHGAPTLRS